MVKRGKNQKQKHWNSMNSNSKLKKNEDVDMNDMDDDIDAFHKQRDMVPLDVDADSGDSDEDDVQPVFEYKGIDGSDEEDEDDDDDDKVDYRDKKLVAKIVRQQKYLREKTGGVDDDISDDDEEEENGNGTAWSRSKNIYYGEDNDLDDEDTLAEEEAEVRRLQQERALSLNPSDFFNPDVIDGEPTLEEMKLKGRNKSSGDKEAEGDAVPMHVEVKKDLDAMSKDEQMDFLYSSAPELPGLLAELNDSYDKLETQVNPLLGKVKKGDNAKKEGKNYLEVKQVLLHAYSQAIVFYLLLRSEGQPAHDHPVIARILEIKSLLDKMKELDEFIPDGLEDALNETCAAAAVQRPAAKHPAASLNTSAELYDLIGGVTEKSAVSEFQGVTDGVKKQPTKINEKKRKLQDQPVSSDSVKMFEKRAELEANFRKKCASGFVAPRTDGSKKKIRKTITGKLETTDDFDDDAVQLGGAIRDNGSLSSKLSRILPANKKKVISGDDDLPERDDLGERRWKHELRVLSSAGISTNNDNVELGNEPESLSPGEDDVEDNVEVDGSEDDYYEQRKRELDDKRRSKAAKHSRNPDEYVLEAETTVDGKRELKSWMEKNRGLTRNRKKQNPRVVKRKKYEDAKKRRGGQVREIRKPTGGYGGETTGINTRVTKSIKFK